VLEGLEAPDADWIRRLGHLQQREKCRVVGIIVKHDRAAVAAIEHMLTQKYKHSVFGPCAVVRSLLQLASLGSCCGTNAL
jgi:hypothetical protein